MNPKLLVLQASSLCNLDCAYCYVPDRLNKATMSAATLRATLKLILSDRPENEPLRILWHAGEPLTVGLKFFERAADIIRECNSRHVAISQALQTNGTLLDQRWCDFFLRERFQIGVSVDGPAAIHDRQRKNRSGRPTHGDVMKGISLLKSNGIALNAVAVLTPHSLDYPNDIFDFFADAGFLTVGFNLEETEGIHSSQFHDRGVAGGLFVEKYRMFMSRLFDRWQRSGRQPRIREFEQMIGAIRALLRDPGFARAVDDLTPFRNISVTREGQVSTFSPELASGTPADPIQFSIGDVRNIKSLEDLAANAKFKAISSEVAAGVGKCRTECEYFPVCGGGTASNKFYEMGTFACAETTSCILHRKALADVVIEKLRALSAERRRVMGSASSRHSERCCGTPHSLAAAAKLPGAAMTAIPTG
jgi:uncharacterized protein